MATSPPRADRSIRPPAKDGIEPIWRRLRAPLLGFFARRTGSTADAEDLLQDLFLHVHTRNGLATAHSQDSYLYAAANNLLRDKARHDKVRFSGQHDDLAALDLVAQEPSPEQILAARQRLEAVKSAIEALPVRTRAVLTLRRFEEMSYAEIAERLGISISAVEKHLVKAVMALRIEDMRFR